MLPTSAALVAGITTKDVDTPLQSATSFLQITTVVTFLKLVNLHYPRGSKEERKICHV